MEPSPSYSLKSHFAKIKDPRHTKRRRHLLFDMLVIAICAVVCGAEGWEDIELFGKLHRLWLKQYIELNNGIPHHDTFRRLFERLRPDQFESCFRDWVQSICQVFHKEVIAIDGKSLRGSYQDGSNKHAGMLHLVSAWASENNLILGQVKTREKSNEITAIPELLNCLAIKGAIITIDAMGCQKVIAEKIKEQKADYVLAVKENQGTLYRAIENSFKIAEEVQFQAMVYDKFSEQDFAHGRIETRTCTVLPMMYLHQFKLKWNGFSSLICVESERVIKATGEVSRERRFYISSLPQNAQLILSAIRQHWGIENKVHWVLDVVFREDDSRIRDRNSAQNFSVLRRMAINMVRRDAESKVSLKQRRKMAGWSHEYLEKILSLN